MDVVTTIADMKSSQVQKGLESKSSRREFLSDGAKSLALAGVALHFPFISWRNYLDYAGDLARIYSPMSSRLL